MEKREYQINKEFINYEFDLNSSNLSIYTENIDNPLIRYTGEFEFEVDGSKIVVTEKALNHSTPFSKLFKFNSNNLLSLIIESAIDAKSAIKNEKNIELIIPTYESCNIPVDIPNLSIAIDSLCKDVNIENLKVSKLTLDISSGNVRLKRVKSNFIDVDTISGDIKMENVASDDVKLKTSSGDISFLGGNTKNVEVDACTGNISLKNIKSDLVNINTSSGDITFDDGAAKKLSISTTVGDLNLTNVEINKLTIDSTSGDVIICNGAQLDDVLISTTIGDISMIDVAPENTIIDTLSGDVEISVVESIMNYKTNLNTMHGDTMSGTLETVSPKTLFDEKYNINVETTSGDIKVLFKGKRKKY